MVVVPAERVLESLEEAAAKGMRAAIVFSSGFAEVGEAGRVAQARLRALAERTGLRIIGPNCQGFAHLPSRLVATFASPFLDTGLATGPIAMVSQSGAMAGMIYEMARAAGLGLNYWVSTGNEADVQAAEILAEVVEDPETRVACCYLEDVKDAGRLRDALARAHRRGRAGLRAEVGPQRGGPARGLLAHRRARGRGRGLRRGVRGLGRHPLRRSGRAAGPAPGLPALRGRGRAGGDPVQLGRARRALGRSLRGPGAGARRVHARDDRGAARGAARLRGRGQPGRPHRADAHRPRHARPRAARARGRSGRGRDRLPDRPARRRHRPGPAGAATWPRSPGAARRSSR